MLVSGTACVSDNTRAEESNGDVVASLESQYCTSVRAPYAKPRKRQDATPPSLAILSRAKSIIAAYRVWPAHPWTDTRSTFQPVLICCSLRYAYPLKT